MIDSTISKYLNEGKPEVTDVFFIQENQKQTQYYSNIIAAMEKQANHPYKVDHLVHLEYQN